MQNGEEDKVKLYGADEIKTNEQEEKQEEKTEQKQDEKDETK